MQQVKLTKLFLYGKNNQVLKMLIGNMEKSIRSLNFKQALKIKNQIQSVKQITEKQAISDTRKNLEIIGVAFNSGVICIHILFVRKGKIIGSRSFFPKRTKNVKVNTIIEKFISEYYSIRNKKKEIPKEILIDYHLNNREVLQKFLSKLSGNQVVIQNKSSKNRAYYLSLAKKNAEIALTSNLSKQSIICQRLNKLASSLKLSEIKRVECFDVSHMMGEQTVASCVVFDRNGPIRSEYRRYNIIGIKPGNDYEAIKQVLFRRYNKIIKEEKIPDLILIDGGKGQLSQARKVFSELNVSWNKYHPVLIAVAKGIKRKGSETIFLNPKGKGIIFPSNSPELHIIQYIRDESHNHAIIGHRKKLVKKRKTSILENISGIGPKRRQNLLVYIGGIQEILNSSIEELKKVPGISKNLAEKIFFSLKQKNIVKQNIL